MKQVVLDTNFGHLINLKLKFKWVSEKGIENILLSPMFIYLFVFFFSLGQANSNAGKITPYW